VFIGFLNLLPLPPFDGGHLAILAVEKIRGKAVDMRKVIPVSAAVAAFLNRATRLPVFAGTLLFWVVLSTVAYIFEEYWWPQAKWFVHLVARGFLIALHRA